MIHAVVAAAILAVFPLTSHADEQAVHLRVRGMAAPKPALKYQLLPEARELSQGNAAHQYLKCFMEQRRFFYGKEAVTDRARYQSMPLADLPLAQLRNYGGAALRQADWAARMDTVDWQDLRRIQEGDLDPLPLEVGPLQSLAAALHVRFRAEVAGGQFDDALRTAKTLFVLARHLGEHPSEIGNMLGCWIAHLCLNALEEMVQQPGCPNLYWALTDLPAPLVDLRKGVQGERTWVAAELRGLQDDAPMTDTQIDAFLKRLSGLMSFTRTQAGKSLRNLRPALQARAKDSKELRAARLYLMEAGFAETLVNRFPPIQVLLLNDKCAYDVQRDERTKLLALPVWQIDALLGAEQLGRDGDGLFADLLPGIVKLRRTQAQVEQQIALLRHVEALRLYAAAHAGTLPALSSELTVPLPADPVSGKPFIYSAAGPTAQLRGCGLQGDKKDMAFIVRYDVTAQK